MELQFTRIAFNQPSDSSVLLAPIVTCVLYLNRYISAAVRNRCSYYEHEQGMGFSRFFSCLKVCKKGLNGRNKCKALNSVNL